MPIQDAQAFSTWGDGRFFFLRRPEGHDGLLAFRMRRHRGQQERRPENARQRQRGGAQDWHVEAVVRGQVAGHAGPHEKADAERDADHRERLRAILRRRNVGDVRLCDGEVPRRQAVDDARREHDPQRVRSGEDEKADERADLRNDQHRLAAQLIRDRSERRSGDELTECV